MRNNNYPKNPLQQRVKGVLILKDKLEDGDDVKTRDFLKTLQCEVLASRENRVTISTSRGNLQHLKECWESKSAESELSKQLNEHLSRIIIGGNL